MNLLMTKYYYLLYIYIYMYMMLIHESHVFELQIEKKFEVHDPPSWPDSSTGSTSIAVVRFESCSDLASDYISNL